MLISKKIAVRLIQKRIREIQDAFPVLVKRATEQDKADFRRDAAIMRKMIEELRREIQYIQKRKMSDEFLIDEEINVNMYKL